MKKTKKAKKKELTGRVFFIIAVAVIFAVSGSLIVSAKYPALFSRIFDRLPHKNKYEENGVPEYVSVKLIPVGKARTGEKIDKVNGIVVHYVGNPGSSAQNNRDYFANPDTGVCSHFVIGLDGEIILCVPLDEKSAASNNRNSDTISIEVCHPDESGKFNDVTYGSLVKLCDFLIEKYSLGPTDIIRHYDVTGKKCPRYYVENPEEWEKFIEDVASFKKND